MGDAEDIQVKLVVMEDELVGMVDGKGRVRDDVPLEYLRGFVPLPADDVERAVCHLIAENHAAKLVGEVCIGLDVFAEAAK